MFLLASSFLLMIISIKLIEEKDSYNGEFLHIHQTVWKLPFSQFFYGTLFPNMYQLSGGDLNRGTVWPSLYSDLILLRT